MAHAERLKRNKADWIFAHDANVEAPWYRSIPYRRRFRSQLRQWAGKYGYSGQEKARLVFAVTLFGLHGADTAQRAEGRAARPVGPVNPRLANDFWVCAGLICQPPCFLEIAAVVDLGGCWRLAPPWEGA